ncbi:MAG: riboflavin kinase [bacterium]|nr:riboflavin kinase [bacterium]
MKFSASIITGTGKGKGLGFPTLNLDVESVPKIEEGVYACFARLGEHGIRVPAVMHYGARPTLGAPPSCEVHILDNIITIPPHSLIVEIVDKIRDVANFGSAEKLSEQLGTDCKAARAMLCVSC